MFNKFSKVILLVLLASSVPVLAQETGIEVSPMFGYTFSEGIDFDPVDLGDGTFANKLTPTRGFTWGFLGDYLVSEQIGVGFPFTDQKGTLEVGLVGGGKRNLTDMNVRNYHGIFTYNLGDAGVRPFFFGGLGATQYSPDDILIASPLAGDAVDGTTKFSTTWGAGVKIYVTDHVGFSLKGRWTPTYINSNPDGIFCSPFFPFGCWVASEANYANQGEFTAGVIFRF